MSWPWRVRRCTCGKAAIALTAWGAPVCVKHYQAARRREEDSPEWKDRAFAALRVLMADLGDAMYDAWVERTIGDEDTWRAIYEKAEHELSISCSGD